MSLCGVWAITPKIENSVTWFFEAASNPGNSGGPLINAEGRQIGIVCAMQLQEQNISYAIPIDRLKLYAEEVIAPEITRDLFAGLTVDCLTAEARVTDVAADSPAGEAGIEPGDVLLAANGSKLRNGLDWLLQLATLKAGDKLALQYRRGEEEKSATVTLRSYPVPQGASPEGTEPGLAWSLYADGKLDDFPDFATLEPAAEGVATELTPRKLAGDREQHFALRFEGFLNLQQEGLYRLVLASDDGSRLFLHDQLLIDNGGPHPRQEIGGKVRLSKGLHPIRIDYFEATGDSTLELFLEDPAGERTKLSGDAFSHTSP